MGSRNILDDSKLRAGDYTGQLTDIRVSMNVSDRPTTVNGETYTASFIPNSKCMAQWLVLTNDNNVIVETIAERQTTSITFTATQSGLRITPIYGGTTGGTGTYGWTTLSVSDVIDAKPQIERSDTAHAYKPYITPTTHTTTYPSAIYRGSEDVVNGEVTSNYGFIDEDDFTFVSSSATPGGLYFVECLTSGDAKAKLNGIGLCNMLPQNNSGAWTSTKPCFQIHPTTEGQIRVFGTFTTLAEFKTQYAGLQLYYELATPTTSSVTPTNLPVKSLSGYNHIESSTGEMTIDYITDAYQNFVNTVESALPNTRKGGVKAFDIFKTLDNPSTDPEPDKDSDEGDKKEEVKEETKDDMR